MDDLPHPYFCRSRRSMPSAYIHIQFIQLIGLCWTRLTEFYMNITWCCRHLVTRQYLLFRWSFCRRLFAISLKRPGGICCGVCSRRRRRAPKEDGLSIGCARAGSLGRFRSGFWRPRLSSGQTSFGLLGQTGNSRTRYAHFQVFKEGWSALEGTHIWAVGRNSVIDIHLPEMAPATRLIMRGRAFVTPARPTATTRISVNGGPATAIQASLDAPSFAQEFDLPGGTRTLRIVLETDNPASPKSLGVSDDARELSIALESLQVRTIQGEDKADPASGRETRSR